MHFNSQNFYLKYIIGLIAMALMCAEDSIASTSAIVESTKPEVKSTVNAPKTSRRRRKKKRKDVDGDLSHKLESGNKQDEEEDETLFGIGLVAGSTATYGNGIILHIDPFDYFGAQVGAGFNSTGAKVGGGATIVAPFTENFGMDAGGAFVHSYGTKDQVSLDAKFTPEDSSKQEEVEAIRKFRLSPAKYYSVFAGAYYDLTDNFRVDLHGNYNKVIYGNHVEFYDQVSYSKPVEASNDETVQKDFEPKARKKLDINGFGFSIGIQFRLL